MQIHTMTITVEVEHHCDSTVAIEEAVACSLADQEHAFQLDAKTTPVIEFRISKVIFLNGTGTVDAGRSIDA